MGVRKLQKFMILFDNSGLLYFPGHFISGRVIVELEDDTPVTGVYFHVVGEGVVRVTDRRQQTLRERENYIDFRMRLLGEPDANYPLDSESVVASSKDQGPIPLSPGIHSFPFKLGLPLGLPSTFLGKHGWVQYFCRAALKEAGGLTHKNQQVFIVMNPIDLNLEPSILAVSTCGYWRGTSDVPVPVLPRYVRVLAGYIRRTRACLTETIQYMSGNKVVETELRELASAARGRIPTGGTDYVPVPVLLRYVWVLAGYIRRTRACLTEFIIEPAGLEKAVKLQLPIMLATYPHRDPDAPALKRDAHYPHSLPVCRPWLQDKDDV
ncbi:arrestin domain-containing protein 17 [Hyalella azteca]|uniref:Arrestin domain-containing protein 17 n=1 Tax=Hyalella azteca TaxID=294128 RepID=A0A979FTL0_HYAAZ|nr:arrestin domain-containing protein 17 [Hyalella azteca]